METLIKEEVKSKIKAGRPFEYVCFIPIEFPTEIGNVYMFMAVDFFTNHSIHAGTEKDGSSRSMLKHLKLLMTHKDFIRQLGTGFTIVLDKYPEIAEKIKEIITPFGGKLIYNDTFVASVTAPFSIDLIAGLKRKQKR